MITTYFISFVVSVLIAVFSLLPEIRVLPYVDSYLSTGMGYFHALAVWIPPLELFLTAFLTILTFKFTLFWLRLLKIFR